MFSLLFHVSIISVFHAFFSVLVPDISATQRLGPGCSKSISPHSSCRPSLPQGPLNISAESLLSQQEDASFSVSRPTPLAQPLLSGPGRPSETGVADDMTPSQIAALLDVRSACLEQSTELWRLSHPGRLRFPFAASSGAPCLSGRRGQSASSRRWSASGRKSDSAAVSTTMDLEHPGRTRQKP